MKRAKLSELKKEFIRLLTEDSVTQDRRKKDFNQAIFMKSDDKYFDGKAVFNDTDLYMVLEKFDKASVNINPHTANK